MKKLFGIIIKILPLITLYKGIASGGARLGPFSDTIKVALTQFEVGQITKLTYDEFAVTGKIPDPAKFHQFLSDNFHHQYSVLARELKGDKSHDLTVDIWGTPYQLYVNENIGQIKIFSAGPDGILANKDDISMDFSFEVQRSRTPARQAQRIVEDVSVEVQPVETTEIESTPEFDEDGFDRDGFDEDGFDRDGYDRNGRHRSEIENDSYGP